MKPLDPLRIQSLVDGELSAAEASELLRQIEQDPQAEDCYQSLTRLREGCRVGELERPVPATREFYWQSIANRIEAGSVSAPVRDESEMNPGSMLAFFIRRWFPIFGTVAILFLIVGAFWIQLGGSAGRYTRLSTNHDIERTSQEISTISFRSESEGITVVWLDTHPIE